VVGELGVLYRQPFRLTEVEAHGMTPAHNPRRIRFVSGGSRETDMTNMFQGFDAVL
jgi:hypothetical protein